MNRDFSNLSIFINNSQSSKCHDQEQKNSSSTNQESSSHQSLHFLPETQFPTSNSPSQFYKLRQRLTSSMFSTRIGYRIRKYSRVEDDYICYLVQLLMTECPQIKVFLIEPNYLYFQVNSISEEVQKQELSEDKEKQRQEIELENKLFTFLKLVSEEIFNPWIDTALQPFNLASQDFSQEKLIQSFSKNVVQKIKQKHKELFTIIKKKQQK